MFSRSPVGFGTSLVFVRIAALIAFVFSAFDGVSVQAEILVPSVLQASVLAGAVVNVSSAGDARLTLKLADGSVIELHGLVGTDGSAVLISESAPLSAALYCSSWSSGSCGAVVVDAYARGDGTFAHRQFASTVLIGRQSTMLAFSTEPALEDLVGSPRKNDALSALGIVLPLAAPTETPEQEERRIGPWLNLTEGGIANGPPQGPLDVHNPDGTTTQVYGTLENGTPLPESGLGIRKLSKKSDTDWGSGFMISILRGASAEFTTNIQPGYFVLLGSIAKQFGGFFPPHKSHQNGLDADIAFMNSKGFDTVLDKERHVTDKFDNEKNWDFFRLLYSQKVRDGTQILPAFTMIFISPEIKLSLCDWAKSQGILANKDDAEIMRRIIPTPGHDDHFHVRLRCSPHYPLCHKQGDPSGDVCK
jgi:penicillin-insensitive murein endopeptidase